MISVKYIWLNHEKVVKLSNKYKKGGKFTMIIVLVSLFMYYGFKMHVLVAIVCGLLVQIGVDINKMINLWHI